MIKRLFKTEPVMYIGSCVAVLDACILVLVAFGLPITTDQKVALDSFSTAVLTLAGLLFTRSQVSPVSST